MVYGIYVNDDVRLAQTRDFGPEDCRFEPCQSRTFALTFPFPSFHSFIMNPKQPKLAIGIFIEDLGWEDEKIFFLSLFPNFLK